MASPIVVEIETLRRQRFMLRDILPGPGWAPYRPDAPAAGRDSDGTLAERVYVDDSGDGRCMKGLLVAVALECVAGLGVVGAWQLWHLLR